MDKNRPDKADNALRLIVSYIEKHLGAKITDDDASALVHMIEVLRGLVVE